MWLVATLAACDGVPVPAETPTPPASSITAPASVLDSLIDRAHELDPGGPQELLLIGAADGSAIDYSDMKALEGDVFTCFDSVGVEYRDMSPVENPPGFKQVAYTFFTDTSDAGELALADDCQEKYFNLANEAYVNSPTAMDAGDAARAAERDDVIACLRDRGQDVPDDASNNEIAEFVFEDMRAQTTVSEGLPPCSTNF